MRKELKTKSKFMSLVLRHDPSAAGIELDENGRVNIEEFLNGAEQKGFPLSRAELDEIVETNEKKRFAVSDDSLRIRANQGHSIKVELGLKEISPPDVLYHGTAIKYRDSIMESGLIKGKRHHVHLSSDLETARSVGMRHGRLLIFRIKTRKMEEEGFKFYRTENGVWLVDHVPVVYLEELSS